MKIERQTPQNIPSTGDIPNALFNASTTKPTPALRIWPSIRGSFSL
jgi:hypothetical protein